MIYCKDCKYFDPMLPPYEWKGKCEIVLPPWITISQDKIGRYVRDDAGCSLGLHKLELNNGH